MRDRKSYRGARTSAGLKDEYNDVFKARAMEKKGATVPQPSKHTTESKDSKNGSSTNTTPTINPAKRKRTSFEQKLVKNTNPKNDVYEMDSSDDEVLERGLKKVKPSTATANTYQQQRPKKQLKDKVFEIETSEEDVIEPLKTKATATSPATSKFQQRTEQNLKSKSTTAMSYQQPPAKKASRDSEKEEPIRKSLKTVPETKPVSSKPVAKPISSKPVAEAVSSKPVAEARNGKSSDAAQQKKPVVAKAVAEAQQPKTAASKSITEARNTKATNGKTAMNAVTLESDSDSEPVRDRTIRRKAPVTAVATKPTKPMEKVTSKSDKVPPKVATSIPARTEKRKARTSSDSESDYVAKPKHQKKQKPTPKETTVKRRKAEESDDEGAKRPFKKRQDRGAKGTELPNPALSKNLGKKKSEATVKKAEKATKASVEVDGPEQTDFVYDHAVDLSYAVMSSPENSKVPSLNKEPSAVEMPSGLAELIESRVAEIGEQQAPVKKAKKQPVTRQPRRKSIEDELINLGTDEVVPGSIAEKEADLQAQINSAMFAADYGVRTTRSKFRNEGAAKKSYGVSQRTMRQPVTEEEQREDDKLELNRSREEAAKQAAKKAHYEEVLRREKEEAMAAAAIAEADMKKGAKKGKKVADKKKEAVKANTKKGSAYDMPEDEDDGPKVLSRHELLQKGRHQRVLNEINALMEDAQKENPTRRSSILDIAYRMSNNTESGKEFTTKFRLNGYPAKLFKNLEAEGDALTRIGYGWTLFILLNEDRYSGHAVELMHENGGFEMLKVMLENDEDMEELARSSVLKLSIQINLVTGKLRNRLLDCRFIRDDVPGSFSQRYVAMMIINTLLKNVSKDEGRKLIFSSFDPRTFVEILGPLNGHTSMPGEKALTSYVLAASILSHYAQGARINRALDAGLDPGHQAVLADVLPTVLGWNTQPQMRGAARTKDLQTAVFKLCIDRTNDAPATSTSVADHKNGLTGIVDTCIHQFRELGGSQDEEVDTSKDVDILVLTTILLSNLLEFSETARMLLRIQRSENVPLIMGLMGVFRQRHDRLELAESVEETHLNVAFGYLTVALAYACREYDLRVEVRSQLGGNLGPLAAAVRQFKDQNQALEDREAAASQDMMQDIMLGEAAPARFSYTARLEDVLGELESYGS
ncbi:hypothetical protein EYR41_005048 [Orbilia oligospora]|uniref:Uncharacterized protein n=1 Tax=Orbilia oligospora TaxID=2813651 RepID=A0A7C8PVI1_ORBOL|nr:hypothetical protein TWF751_009242 [Orbilia oligospora]TGJ68970.1 hypothetical protein EYR41_005048 [Orbilia oligospora]